MPLSATTYRLLKKFRDENFDEDRIGEYHLALLTGPRDLQVLVSDPNANKALWLEDYVFPSAQHDDDWIIALRELFDHHPFLSAGFWNNIRVGVKTPSFVHHPIELFSETDAITCLGLNATLTSESEVITCRMHERGLAVAFALPAPLKKWITSVYAGNKPCFLHQSCALIEGVLQELHTYKENSLFIFVDRFRLHILVANQQGLRYYNQFAIHHFNDYIHYIMLVMHAHRMDPQNARVILWGFVGRNSPHYHEFYKYIRTITYGNRTKALRFGYVFDEIQEHQYFDVLNLTHVPLNNL